MNRLLLIDTTSAQPTARDLLTGLAVPIVVHLVLPRIQRARAALVRQS